MSESTFSELSLEPTLVDCLTSHGFNHPTPIQEQSIPIIMEGKDIFAQAETGSGKTGAFIIPVISKLMNEKTDDGGIGYLVLSPTRELAQQIEKVADTFTKEFNLSTTCVIGGEDFEKQQKAIDNGVDILIATPGRLLDLLRRKAVKLDKCRGLVLDEVDRLFDMGFKKEINGIIKALPEKRQMLMFSATSNLEVLNMAYKYHSVPTEIKLNSENVLVDHINHGLYHLGDDEKMRMLVGLLRRHPDAYCIVFANTQNETHILEEWLKKIDPTFKVASISGRLTQARRTKLMEQFRNKEATILICTDVAARGLDIKDVNLVINYDLPQDAASYVHRIGRTGRAGAAGQAISFCAYRDCEYLPAIEEYIEASIPNLEIDEELLNQEVGSRPRPNSKANYEGKNMKSKDGRTRQDVNGNKSHEKRKETPQTHTPRHEKSRTPRSENAQKKPVTHNVQRIDIRKVSFVTTNPKKMCLEALTTLPVNDVKFIDYQVEEKGSRTWLGFGPRKSKYKFTVKPLYDDFAKKFLDKVITLMDLKVACDVKLLEGNLEIEIFGDDEELLTAHHAELLNAFDHLLRKHLNKLIELKRSFTINIKCNNISSLQAQQGRDRSQGRNSRSRNGSSDTKVLNLAKKTLDRMTKEKKDITLNSMSAKDRRLIHQFFSEQEQKFTTTSIGDGKFKKIKVAFK